jgi:hypothetical protein
MRGIRVKVISKECDLSRVSVTDARQIFLASGFSEHMDARGFDFEHAHSGRLTGLLEGLLSRHFQCLHVYILRMRSQTVKPESNKPTSERNGSTIAASSGPDPRAMWLGKAVCHS